MKYNAVILSYLNNKVKQFALFRQKKIGIKSGYPQGSATDAG